MKPELKAKFLQHLSQKKQDQGFTLIELLVVIIIIGILSAIALPSFLNQANKAKESEAKQYVGSANRAEQAFYLEKSKFTSDWGNLGLGIATQTANYKYTVETADANLGKQVEIVGGALPDKTNTLRAFVGGVQVGQISGTQETTTLAILCQSPKPQTGTKDGVKLTPNTTTAPACNNSYENLSN
ncbi:prepilin-type N-terminal cleavage/methylation domain protein [Coleofasciculus chthonoplastes PCC 7420]|uniref:Prepilin-type N-terminal cleavage/methylation domain protein n=1 Tax=Coleofasciculus chthonoplastes PCC 7420 TaxID=118168 RepID=B4VTE5_9CYAN|nr:type IV pilin-like G/H family protein [Coleofasciculus chthonoplastes]EDX74837.1 prepilin-type N-terminal cleavage/methylation domain protein [Coleofasciculus chthonoplastes PCC 7420]